MFIYIEKLFDKTQHLSLIKTLQQARNKGKFFKLVKGSYEKPIARDQEKDQEAGSHNSY